MQDAERLPRPLIDRHRSLYPVFRSIRILDTQIPHQGILATQVQLIKGDFRRTYISKYRILYSNGYTVHLQVRDGTIAFVDSPCPDHLCEGFGRLSREGDWAACMPAHVSVTVE